MYTYIYIYIYNMLYDYYGILKLIAMVYHFH